MTLPRAALALLVAALVPLLPAAAGAQAKPVRFIMSSTPSFTWTPFLVAQNVTFEAMRQALGRGTEVTYAPTPAPALLALLAGEQDFGIMYVQHAIKAQAEGKELVVLATLMENPTVALLARTDLPEIRTPADIKGKVFGVVGLGSGHHMIGLAVAEAYGVNPDEVTWRSTGGVAGWIPAMRAKRVDVLLASEPTLSRLVDEGLGRVLIDFHGREATEKIFAGPHPTVAVIARRDFVEANPKVAQAVVDAHVKALAWIHAQPPKAVVGTLPESLRKLPNAEAILERVVPAISRTGRTDLKAVAITGEWMKRMGEIPKDYAVDPEQVVEGRFVKGQGAQ